MSDTRTPEQIKRDKMKARIEQLIRLATPRDAADAASRAEEISRAAEKAQELMTLYRISSAELGIETHQEPEHIEFRVYHVTSKNRAASQRRDGMCYILSAFAAKVVTTQDIGYPNGSLMGHHLRVFAPRTTLDMLDALIPTLITLADNAMVAASQEYRLRLLGGLIPDQYGAAILRRQIADFCRSWWIGFGSRTAARVRAAQQKVVDESANSTGAALVLQSDMDRIQNAIDMYYTEGLKKNRSGRAVNAEGYLSGKKYGSTVLIGQADITR